jgi:hypothetical protein
MKEVMYRKENQILVSLITTIVILGLYTLNVYNNHVANNPDIINNMKFWAKSFIILIPVLVVAQIIIHIIYAIINKIITKEDIPTNSDEMDKMIELKSIRISRWISPIFFFLAMGSLLLELPIWIMFVLFICSFFISSIVESILQIYFYKKGV